MIEWTIHPGDVLALIMVGINFYVLMTHKKKDCKNLTTELTEIKTKVGIMYEWFLKHVVK